MPFGGNAFDTEKFVGYKEMMERVTSYFGDDIIRLEDDPHDTTKVRTTVKPHECVCYRPTRLKAMRGSSDSSLLCPNTSAEPVTD